MCGIVGYIGKERALPILMDGLKRLEYRGYDSAGVCVLGGDAPLCVRASGKIANLEDKLSSRALLISGTLGIAHTRWATHGAPTVENAHPHADCAKGVYVVHNGIVENWRELREELEMEGHLFASQTDTEVLAHLIEKYDATMVLEDAVVEALNRVDGTFGIAVVSVNEPGKMVIARRSSPLLIGVGAGECLVASDASAVMARTKDVIYLNDDEMAIVTPGAWELKTLDRKAVTRAPETLEWSQEEAHKGGYVHFMAKEIHEAPDAISNALRGRLLLEEGNVKLGGLEDITEALATSERFVIVSCGTSYYASLAGAMMIEECAGVPVEVYHASEFRYRAMPLNAGTIVLGISQSGETADTLAAIRKAKEAGLMTLGMVNVVGSSIARETHAGIYNHAGPEIGVASTKAFISQLTVFSMLAVHIGRLRTMSAGEAKKVVRELVKLPELAVKALAREEDVRAIAGQYAPRNNFLYIGRKYGFPTALEGALKLKEISYIHAEGYAAGEMKHGPIALVSPDFPTIAVVPQDPTYEKTLSNIQEIKARGGQVIAVATEGDERIREIADDVFYVPRTLEMLQPILSVIPLQLFAYHAAVIRGCDVDKPRNLAKSVTVE